MRAAKRQLRLIETNLAPNSLLREKRLKRIGLRCPETLKEHLDRRAAARNVTLSEHMLQLAIADLAQQGKRGRTLFDTARELQLAAELARAGIESDEQRLWVLQRTTAFQAAVLHTV